MGSGHPDSIAVRELRLDTTLDFSRLLLLVADALVEFPSETAPQLKWLFHLKLSPPSCLRAIGKAPPIVGHGSGSVLVAGRERVVAGRHRV